MYDWLTDNIQDLYNMNFHFIQELFTLKSLIAVYHAYFLVTIILIILRRNFEKVWILRVKKIIFVSW